MKRIAWLFLISVALMVASASAAHVDTTAPSRLQVGEPLIVTGTTVPEGLTKPSVDPGTQITIQFYYAEGTKKLVETNQIVIQQDGTFQTVFQTTGLKKGSYTLEIHGPTQDTFGTSSKTMLFVTLIDRSDEITITSPLTQTFDGTLTIAGSISGLEDRGVQIEVRSGSDSVFGPRYIPTDKTGKFSQEVAVPAGGVYDVRLTDYRGYIGTVTFTVVQQTTSSPTGETPGEPSTVSATATASRDAPAYFTVDTKAGSVRIVTSAGVDWVIEYIDESSKHSTVNSKGKLAGEEATISAQGGEIAVKVYPAVTGESGTVTLTATNAASVTVSQTASALFGGTPMSPAQTSAQATPLPAVLALLALFVVFAALRR